MLWGAPASADYKGHPFALGLELGDPTGFTGKYWLDGESALQFGVGGHPGYRGGYYARTSFAGTFDWLYHFGRFGPSRRQLWFRVHVGVGGAVGWVSERCYSDVFYSYCDTVRSTRPSLVARIPVGLNLYFKKARFEVFAQIAPGIRFLPDVFRPTAMGSFGGRFYF
jgi:hypothetical protein